jgi:orotate phosphoribosyltransferase
MSSSMDAYKQSFIEFMVRARVLTFGAFVTKSGRETPFFVNTGRYHTGAQIAELAGFYADAIEAQSVSFDFLFGPAYKGIPLAVATALVLSQRGRNVSFCFNRKEIKDHGEGGNMVGHVPTAGERGLIIEDVTTAGTSIRESVPLLQQFGATAVGLVVSVDRMERGTGELNALTEIQQQFKMHTFAIVTIEEIMSYLRGRRIDGTLVLTDELFGKMQEYRARYGGTC